MMSATMRLIYWFSDFWIDKVPSFQRREKRWIAFMLFPFVIFFGFLGNFNTRGTWLRSWGFVVRSPPFCYFYLYGDWFEAVDKGWAFVCFTASGSDICGHIFLFFFLYFVSCIRSLLFDPDILSMVFSLR